VIALALLLVLAQGLEVRAFWADVRLRGPLESVRFDCGPDGTLELDAGLVAGEERVLQLPFPVRSPLGVPGLAALPPPEIEVSGGAPDAARFLGWSDPQPGAALARLHPTLLGRPRPPVPSSGARIGAAQAALLGAFLLLAVAARRRPAVACALGLLGGGVLLALAAGRAPAARTLVVEELDLALGQAFSVRAGSGALELDAGEGPERLEASPGDGVLAFALALDGDRASAVLRADRPATRLYDLGTLAFEPVGRARNTGPDLVETWVRSSAGRWTAHGAWSSGSPLPASREGLSPAPGWLSAGLPPGRGVLLGRRGGAQDTWIRVLGF
jgi:hypothetical protein